MLLLAVNTTISNEFASGTSPQFDVVHFRFAAGSTHFVNQHTLLFKYLQDKTI
jgi:hypothetical protein